MAVGEQSATIQTLKQVLSSPDPRRLNTLDQTLYIIGCLEQGLTRSDILNLFMGDDFSVDLILELIRYNELMSYDEKGGKWYATERTRALFV